MEAEEGPARRTVSDTLIMHTGHHPRLAAADFSAATPFNRHGEKLPPDHLAALLIRESLKLPVAFSAPRQEEMAAVYHQGRRTQLTCLLVSPMVCLTQPFPCLIEPCS